MEKLDCLNQVAEFHRIFGAPILERPQIPSRERSQLRIALLQEELDELKKAVEDQDITEAADALCDLQYVLSGAVLEFGLGEKFGELFNEVQRSNLSKACSTEEEADATIKHYAEKGQQAYAVVSGSKINVHRKEDQKVLKSINYSPADLKTIIEK